MTEIVTVDGPLKGKTLIVTGNHVSIATTAMLWRSLGGTVIFLSITSDGESGGDQAMDVKDWGVFKPDHGQQLPLFYHALNSGPGGMNVALNLSTDKGKALLYQALSQTDAFVTNLLPRGLGKLGLDSDSLRTNCPNLTAAYISAFGEKGKQADRPGYHHLALLESGIAMLNGEDEPSLAGVPWVDVLVGNQAAFLLAAGLQTPGNHYFTSLLQVAIQATVYYTTFALTPEIAEEFKVEAQADDTHLLSKAFGYFMCSDGVRVFVGGVFKGQAKNFLDALGREDVFKRDDFAGSLWRVERADELLEIVREAVGQRTSTEVMELCTAARVPAGVARPITELLSHPAVIDNQMVREDETPSGMKFYVPAGPSGTNIERPSVPTPARYLGQDTMAGLGLLGLEDSAIGQAIGDEDAFQVD